MPSETTISAILSLSLLGLFFWYWSTERQAYRRWLGSVLTAIIASCALFAIFPNAWKGDFSTTNIAKGIDLGGGTSFVVEIPEFDDHGNAIPVNKQILDEVREVIEKRLRNLISNRNKTIRPIDDRMLEIQIPGLNADQISKIEQELKRPAVLNLHLVKGNANAVNANELPIGQQIFELQSLNPSTEEENSSPQRLILPSLPSLEGTHIVRSSASQSAQQGWIVNISLDNEGGDIMGDITRNNVGRAMAIVLDGVMISAPVIQGPFSKTFTISGDVSTGGFSKEEAVLLANALQNPLRTPITVDGKSTLSATLGKTAVSQGIWSGISALGATLLFMVIFYRFAGIIALFGLTINMLILFGAVALAQQDLTLPGIAGVILTLGMAVDANVLIFERLKEELREGKNITAALESAYKKAFSAIFDANITSLITAIVLFSFGSDALKGFAATLTAGILGTLFAALLVTRTGFRWMTDFNLLKKLSVGKVWVLSSFDFISKSKQAVFVSLFVIACAVTGIFWRGEQFLSADFVGGQRVTYEIPKGVDPQLDDARKALATIETAEEPTVQVQSTPTGTSYLIVNFGLDKNNSATNKTPLIDRVKASLADHPAVAASLAAGNIANEVTIGASFGKLMLQNSGKALIIGLIGIALYLMIRFQVGFAIGAIAALVHDLIITIGIMAICGFELNTIMVGAYLTIAGYSINDTIVVFDRIREALADSETTRPDIKALINKAINNTLSRTLLTSGTTLLAVSILAIFGGPELRSFSIAILVGVLVGTWSSIFIASPLVYFFARKKGAAALKDTPQKGAIEAQTVDA